MRARTGIGGTVADAAIGDLIRTADAGADAAADELFARLYHELHAWRNTISAAAGPS